MSGFLESLIRIWFQVLYYRGLDLNRLIFHADLQPWVGGIHKLNAEDVLQKFQGTGGVQAALLNVQMACRFDF